MNPPLVAGKAGRGKRKWMQKLDLDEGSLTAFARRHGALNADGTINLDKARTAAEALKGQERARRLRQVNLAGTFRRSRHKALDDPLHLSVLHANLVTVLANDGSERGADAVEVFIDQFRAAFEHEMAEHGDSVPDDPISVAEIVLDHLRDDPGYYSCEDPDSPRGDGVGAPIPVRGDQKEYGEQWYRNPVFATQLKADIEALFASCGAKAGTGSQGGSLATTHGPPPGKRPRKGGQQREIQGITTFIEHPKGSTRSGINAMGEKWERQMQCDYGYIPRTEGADGEPVDCFIGDKAGSDSVTIVNQIRQDTGEFDETKVMLAFGDETEAVQTYRAHYPTDWKVGPTRTMSVAAFTEWLRHGDTTVAAKAHPEPDGDECPHTHVLPGTDIRVKVPRQKCPGEPPLWTAQPLVLTSVPAELRAVPASPIQFRTKSHHGEVSLLGAFRIAQKAEAPVNSDQPVGQPFIIYGPASVAILDTEREVVDWPNLSPAVRKKVVSQILEAGALSVDHKDVIVGAILPEHKASDGYAYKTDIHVPTAQDLAWFPELNPNEETLFVVANIRDNSVIARRVRAMAMSGEVDCFSITFHPLHAERKCNGAFCADFVTDLDLFASTLCKRGKNSSARWLVLERALGGHDSPPGQDAARLPALLAQSRQGIQTYVAAHKRGNPHLSFKAEGLLGGCDSCREAEELLVQAGVPQTPAREFLRAMADSWIAEASVSTSAGTPSTAMPAIRTPDDKVSA